MPRAVDHAERRTALVGAVLGLVREGGTGAVTIRSVADRIGRSTAAVTHYVRGRDGLLYSAVAWALEDRRRLLTEAAGATDPLRSVLLRSIDADDAIVWRALLVATAEREPHLTPLIDDFDAWWTDLVHELVTETGIDGARVVTDTLGAIVDGLVMTVDADGWSDARRAAVIERSLVALVPVHR